MLQPYISFATHTHVTCCSMFGRLSYIFVLLCKMAPILRIVQFIISRICCMKRDLLFTGSFSVHWQVQDVATFLFNFVQTTLNIVMMA
jgi:hypothetical protein